jgi:homoaconitate hydratase family protein
MNMVEKILASASGKKEVRPGEVVIANVDLMIMHDLSANFVMKVFENELGGQKIKDPDRIAFVFDHNFAPATHAAAEALAAVRKFSARHGIRHLFDCGHGSIHHTIIEERLWAPGQVIIGCDSHTPAYGALGLFATGVGNNSMAALGFPYSLGWFRVPDAMQIVFHGKTSLGVSPRDVCQTMLARVGEEGAIYKAVEYAGPYIESLSIEDRTLFPLVTIDIGGKCGFVNPDNKTCAFAKSVLGDRRFEIPVNDPGTRYTDVIDIDVSGLEPQIACPPTVGNVKPVQEMAGLEIDIAEIGGSTGGRLSDIRQIAACLANKCVSPGVRLQVVPATRGIYSRALREGLLQVLHDAGANIFPPSCGSNQAYNMGAMARDEVMVSTQARNFPGRNGHPEARHYLGSTWTVAAAALKGKITDPRQVFEASLLAPV